MSQDEEDVPPKSLNIRSPYPSQFVDEREDSKAGGGALAKKRGGAAPH